MPKSTDLVLTQNQNNQSVTLTDADTTVAKLCFTAEPTYGSNVKAIIATSTDAVAIMLKVYICRGGNDYLLGTVQIPTANGTNGSDDSVDILNTNLNTGSGTIAGLPVDNVGKTYISMEAGDTLKVGCLTTMTAAETCTVNIFGEDFAAA